MTQQHPAINPAHPDYVVPAFLQSPQALAEEAAWAHLYRAVRQYPAAAEVVRHLDSDAEAKERHLALYLVACETLHTKALDDAQAQRIAAVLRTVFVRGPRIVWAMVKAVVTPAAPEPAAAPVQPEQRTPAASRARARVRTLAMRADAAPGGLRSATGSSDQDEAQTSASRKAA